MALVSSIVIWTDEPPAAIRAMVESGVVLHNALEQSGFCVTRYTSVLSSTVQQTRARQVQQWVAEFTETSAAHGFEFLAVRFDPNDPHQTLSSGKQHLFASSLFSIGDRIILHDIPFDDAMAAWAVNIFLSIGWPTHDCLVVVTTPPDDAIHLAFCTSSEAYLQMGLLSFTSADYHALGHSTVSSLDELCHLMISAARRNGWGVKHLCWPTSQPLYLFGFYLMTLAVWVGSLFFTNAVPVIALAAFFCLPVLNIAWVIALWRTRAPIWQSLMATLLLLPQLAYWLPVVGEVMQSLIRAK